MLKTRALVAAVLLPLVIAGVLIGGPLYAGGVTAILALGTWEIIGIGRAQGFRPELAAALIMVAAILLSTAVPEALGPGVALSILLAMALSLYQYYHGDETPMTSFQFTLGTGLLIGWLGAHLLRLRSLPGGEWLTLLVLFCIFAADTGAYLVGRQVGRHKMSPKASPGKSWEGYFGGVITAGVLGAAGAALLGQSLLPALRWHDGLFLGLLLSALVPLGDLTISMFKRQANVKDSSHLIPGHGGMMDRLDTVIVGAALGFYYFLWFVP